MIALHDPADYPPYVEPAPEPFPEPLVTSDQADAMPATVPAPVLGVQRAAELAGWETRVTYAKGHSPHATHGRPGPAAVDLWAVRMRRGQQRAVAVRTGASWDMLYVWSPEVPWTAHPALGSLRYRLIHWASMPDGVEFAEVLASKKRGPAYLRLIDGATYADYLGAGQGCDAL